MDSSDSWILHYADRAPAFYTVDQGYDVWLGNFRGNKYSRNHTEMDPDTNMTFWREVNWRTHSDFDLPASFDYIARVTGYKKVAYVGHSMGTTVMFRMMATNYNYFHKRVSVYIPLAPLVHIAHT